MARAAVARPDRETLRVPLPYGHLNASRLEPAPVRTQRVHGAAELGGRGDVAAQHAARLQHLADRVHALPGSEHVEDHAVDPLRTHRLDEITDTYVPCRVLLLEEALHVLLGDRGEVGAALVRVELSRRPDGPQQRERQSARADTRLEHPRPREDVGVHEDLRGVLGIDHGRATRHRDRVLLEQRTQREVRDALRRGHDDTVRAVDEVVVVDAAPGRVERRPRRQLDRVPPPLRVEQGDALPRLQRSCTDPRPVVHRVLTHCSPTDHSASCQPGPYFGSCTLTLEAKNMSSSSCEIGSTVASTAACFCSSDR